MNFLELIDAYANLREQAGQAWEVPGVPPAEEIETEAQKLRAEIERRLNLAGADHHLAIWRHLNGGEQSRARQRNLLDVAARERRAGIPVERAVQYIEQSIVDEWKAQHP
jgi:hypothetical protein